MGISLFMVWQKKADYPKVKTALAFFLTHVKMMALDKNP
jgi:tryptophan-rich sensory protein